MPVLASIRVRLTLWYVLLLAVILAVFGASVYLPLRRSLYSALDESIQSQAGLLRDALRIEGDPPTPVTGTPSGTPSEEERFARVFDASGTLVFDGSTVAGDVPVDSGAMDRALGGETSTRRVKVEGEGAPLRILTVFVAKWPISGDFRGFFEQSP